MKIRFKRKKVLCVIHIVWQEKISVPKIGIDYHTWLMEYRPVSEVELKKYIHHKEEEKVTEPLTWTVSQRTTNAHIVSMTCMRRYSYFPFVNVKCTTFGRVYIYNTFSFSCFLSCTEIYSR